MMLFVNDRLFMRLITSPKESLSSKKNFRIILKKETNLWCVFKVYISVSRKNEMWK